MTRTYGKNCVFCIFILTAVKSKCISEYKGPPSGASSAKQSPALQHRAMGPRSALQDER